MSAPPQSGFTLIETIVAAGILAVALVALAHLVVVATRTTTAAGVLTTTTVMAQQKLEQLVAMGWNDPKAQPGPAWALDEDVSGYVEYLDAEGRVRGQSAPGGAAVFVRRWAITSVSATTRVIQVVVRRSGLESRDAGSVTECRLTAVRTRITP